MENDKIKGLLTEPMDKPTDFFEEVSNRLEFQYWLFGYYHDTRKLEQNYVFRYEQIAQAL